MYSVATILNKSKRETDKLNVLSVATHERYESGLAKTQHNFYAYHGKGLKTWNPKYAPVPKNYTLMDGHKDIAQIPTWLNFDCVLGQSKSHTPYVKQFAAMYDVPLIMLEHTTPQKNLPRIYLEQLKEQTKGDVNVFITEWSCKEWGFSPTDKNVFIINHGIDTDLFSPTGVKKNKRILTVANEYRERSSVLGFDIYERITQGLPCFPVGDSTGFSKPASSTEELASFYNSEQVFLNTSTSSPIPMSVLEAMSCGCAVVTTATGDIPNIIEHGKNGFITNDENKLREYLIKCLGDVELCRRLGEAARKTILERYNMDQFVQSWNKVFAVVADETSVTIRNK